MDVCRWMCRGVKDPTAVRVDKTSYRASVEGTLLWLLSRLLLKITT